MVILYLNLTIVKKTASEVCVKMFSVGNFNP